jgi:hypothetical protein
LQARRRAAGQRADQARREADAAPADQKAAAQRTAAQAREDEKEVAGQLDEMSKSVGGIADSLLGSLDPYAPETTAARDIVSQQLAPALKLLVQVAKVPDAGPADRAAADARQAIEAAQRELAKAQDAMAERDPLVAAKAYAKAAADALLRKPPDFQGAQRHQQNTVKQLDRAWDLSLRRAATQRLAMVPSLKQVLTIVPPPDARSVDSTKAASATKDWRRLRARDQDITNATLREATPPEYEAALDLYFKALNKARDGK